MIGRLTVFGGTDEATRHGAGFFYFIEGKRIKHKGPKESETQGTIQRRRERRQRMNYWSKLSVLERKAGLI